MKLNKIFTKLWPHILVIIGFVVLSYAYFNPVLAGKDLPQMDNTHAVGMAHEINDYEKSHPGEHPMWTNSMFGGMPAYLITGSKSFNIFHSLQPYIRLFLPYTTVSILFLLLCGFYFLMISLKVNQILGVAGAIGFAFATFNILIIMVGHIIQAYAISFIPMIIAGILMLFNKKYLAGGILTVFSLGIEISFSHPQITYYCFIMILILFIIKLIYAIIEKEFKHYLIVVSIFIFASILAFLPNIVNLWTTSEYGNYSMRGPSEISKKDEGIKSPGLEKNYALAFSYGKAETFSLLVPNIMGAGVNGYKEDSKTAEELQKDGLQDAARVAASLPVYWGDQSFRSAPTYFGAIICFLFIFGLFILKGAEKWWLLITAIVTIVLAWGKNFLPVTDLFFYYFPGYSKFRSVEMILVIADFAFGLTGFLALKEIIEGKVNKQDAIKALKYASGIVGGLLLIFVLIPGWFFDYSCISDNQIIEQLRSSKWPNDMINSLLAAMRDDRQTILRMDAFRSLVFVALAALIIWAYITKKVKPVYLSIILVLIILVDLWSVDRRYLNKDNFVDKADYENQFIKTTADEFILRDQNPDYRVLNLTKSVFNDAFTPYFHKSIGGYHGAKMHRYQDMIDGPLYSDLNRLMQLLKSQPSQQSIGEGLKQVSILNMLNTKYIIYNPESAPIINKEALGNAWFVQNIKWVNNPNEEYGAVVNFDPSTTAIIDKRWEKILTSNVEFKSNSSDTIKLLVYKPDNLLYQSNSQTQHLAVFSEIFYDKGWNAYIDGKLAHYGRANYILRAMTVPAGLHKIEFKFEPKSYKIGQIIALISSIVVILIFIGFFINMIIRPKEIEA
jgi:hypothetical protein